MTTDLTQANPGFITSSIHPDIKICGDDAKYTGSPWNALEKKEKERLVRAFRKLFPEWSAQRIADAIGGIKANSISSTANRGGIPLKAPGGRSQKAVEPRKGPAETAQDLKDEKAICTPHRDPPRPSPPIAKRQAATPPKSDADKKDSATAYWNSLPLSTWAKCVTGGHEKRAALSGKPYCPDCCRSNYQVPKGKERKGRVPYNPALFIT
jgi:hypothetical protein